MIKKFSYIRIPLIAAILLCGWGTAHATAINGKCSFDSAKQDYSCSADAEDQVPAGCTAEIIQSPNAGMDCKNVPSGYSAPSISVTASVSPSTVAAGGQRPVISWQSSSIDADPTTCSIAELGATGLTASGDITAPAATAAGSLTYTVTCGNKTGAKSGSDAKTIQVTAQTAATANTNTSSNSLGKCGAIGNQLGYCPLEPLPGLQNVANINFAQFLGAIFKLLITAGALFAVILLVIGGIGYIISGSGVEIGEAKRRIWAALYGFIILVGAWLLLYTINPTLLNFNLNSIGGNPDSNADTTSTNAPSGSAIPDAAAQQQQINSCVSNGGHLDHAPNGSVVCN